MADQTRGSSAGPSAPAGALAPQRFEFATTDPDEAQAFIDTTYNARVGPAAAFDRSSPVRLSQVSAGEISSVDSTMPPELILHLEGSDDLSVTTLTSGTLQAELGKRTERYQAGQVCLGAFPGERYLLTCHQVQGTTLTLSAAALARAAAALPTARPDQTPAPLRFASLAPASPGAGEQWRRAAAFVRGILDDEHSAASPLILGSAARLLAATALAVFPNTLLCEHDHGRGADGLSGPAASDTVRRAEDYLHAHAHDDIDLADLAAACGVTPRALQYAFARHHDTSPMRYLRRLRLARAHQDLLDADPATNPTDTVTAIAARWGFPHPGRFAAAYRHSYGQPPSTTLRA